METFTLDSVDVLDEEGNKKTSPCGQNRAALKREKLADHMATSKGIFLAIMSFVGLAFYPLSRFLFRAVS